eukprot:5494888-Prymnesium_polylepis.1
MEVLAPGASPSAAASSLAARDGPAAAVCLPAEAAASDSVESLTDRARRSDLSLTRFILSDISSDACFAAVAIESATTELLDSRLIKLACLFIGAGRAGAHPSSSSSRLNSSSVHRV